jgi:hypothetical protein
MIRSSAAESEFSRLRIPSLTCGSSRSLKANHRLYRRNLIFQPVRKFAYGKVAQFLFLFETIQKFTIGSAPQTAR